MKKSFKYRIYPSKSQTSKITATLQLCCSLYNAALEERIGAFNKRGTSIKNYEQQKQLPEIKDFCPEYKDVFSQVLQDTLKRLDNAYKSFFLRIKRGQNPGFPRYKSIRRYNSLTYPQHGFYIKKSKVFLSKIGHIPIKMHRPIEGKVKTCTIKRTPTGKWFVTFSCLITPKILGLTEKSIGIDLGIKSFAAYDDGTLTRNPKFFKKDYKDLARAQRKAQKTKNFKIVRRIHERIKNRRANFSHQLSRKIINNNGIIVAEKLDIKLMLKGKKFSKGIYDASWFEFIKYLSYKAEEAGRIFILVNPAYTTQTCSGCGEVKLKNINERIHYCECGLTVGRDINAAINIKALGLQSLEKQTP